MNGKSMKRTMEEESGMYFILINVKKILVLVVIL